MKVALKVLDRPLSCPTWSASFLIEQVPFWRYKVNSKITETDCWKGYEGRSLKSVTKHEYAWLKKLVNVSNAQRLSVRWNQEDSSYAFVKGRTSRIQGKNSEAVCFGARDVAQAQFTWRRRNLKLQQSPVILYLCLRKTRAGKSRDYRDVIVIEKLRFPTSIPGPCHWLGIEVVRFKTFLSTRKRNIGIFKFLRFEERFRKAPFWWRISVGGRPSSRNKAGYFNQNKGLG